MYIKLKIWYNKSIEIKRNGVFKMIKAKKELILNNAKDIESNLNSFLSDFEQGQYNIDFCFQVPAGRGFRTNQLMLTVYKIGEYGVDVIFDTETFELIRTRTVGKFDKEYTKEITNVAIWLYMFHLQVRITNIVASNMDVSVNMDGINLIYSLDKNVFSTEEEYYKALKDTKEGSTSADQVKHKIDHNIINFYSSIYNNFNGNKLSDDDIIYRHVVESYIENKYNTSQYWSFFSILKSNNIIGVCSRGYTFNLLFKTKSHETANTNIDNESENETNYIVSNNVFKKYSDAYEFSINNEYKLTSIYPTNSMITYDQMHQLIKKYTFSKYLMTNDELLSLLNFLNSSPINADSAKIIDGCNFLLDRLSSSKKNKLKNKNNFTIMVRDITYMDKKLKQNGIIREELGSSIIRYKKNDQILLSYSLRDNVFNWYYKIKEIYKEHVI